MRNFSRVCLYKLFIILLLPVTGAMANTSNSKSSEYKSIDWLDLLTPDEQVLKAAEPEVDHSNNSIIPDAGPQGQTGSDKVRVEMDGKKVRIPGFVVPLEIDDEGKITEFFLVPFFGACIHVPPPPPNQIIYVSYPNGLMTDVIYSPFYVEGTISTKKVMNEVAYSAYSFTAVDVRPYD